MKDGVNLILQGSQEDFPVVEGRQVIGILHRTDLFLALAQSKSETLVAKVMRKDFEAIEASDPLENVFSRMQENGFRILPVMQDEVLVGLLTAENMSEFLLIQTAMSQRKSFATEQRLSEQA